MKNILLALLLLFCQTAFAQQKVEYKIVFMKPGTNSVVTEIKVGQEADVGLFVRDLRPNGEWTTPTGAKRPLARGVFAAYCDIRFNYNCVQVIADSFEFGPLYPNGKESHAAKGFYDDTGSFAASFSGLGTTPCEVFRFRIKGVRIGTGTFTPSLDVVRPKYNTLVYGNIAATPPEESNVDPAETKLTAGTIKVLSAFGPSVK